MVRVYATALFEKKKEVYGIKESGGIWRIFPYILHHTSDYNNAVNLYTANLKK